MKKVMFIVSNLRASNGVTRVIMNHYFDLIEKGYTIDFCSMYDRPSPWFDELNKSGSDFLLFPQVDEQHSCPDYAKSKVFLKEQFEKIKYDIVHIHITGKYALLAAKLAKAKRVPYRVYHAHNPLYIHDIHSALYTAAYHIPCVFLSNRFLACSISAGDSCFRGRKFQVIKNTIDVDSIQFDIDSRKRIRDNLNLQDNTTVIGTVCRQTKQKNPFFIVDVFTEYHKINVNSVLIWVGTGELEQEVRKYIRDKNLENKIIFLGNQTDMKSMYSAMDIFLLPSLYEGLGIVFVEAQANGLLTYASDVVPEDTRLTDLIHYISLKKDAKEWANDIKSGLNSIKDYKREKYANYVKSCGYDQNNNHDLVNYYDALI